MNQDASTGRVARRFWILSAVIAVAGVGLSLGVWRQRALAESRAREAEFLQEAEMLRQARAWRLEALDEVLDSINTADVATKTTGLPDQLIAERLLLEIAGRARRLGL